MGHKHTREQILAGALDVAVQDGLSRLSFGRVARALGVSDRIVVYYFPTKDALVAAVLGAVGERLRQVLVGAFTAPAADHVALAAAAWPALTHPDADALFRLFFEANGLAVAGREPFRAVVGGLAAAWVDWLGPFLDGPPDHRRAEAEAAMAVIDGLLLLRLLAGPDAADRAAGRLGIG